MTRTWIDTDEISLAEAEFVAAETAASACCCTDGPQRVVTLVTRYQRRPLEELTPLGYLEALRVVYGPGPSRRSHF